VTCYFRHLQNFFEEANIKVTPENKRKIDQALHAIVGVGYNNCPATWREVKSRLKDERSRQDLIVKLRARIATLQISSSLPTVNHIGTVDNF